MQRIKCTTKREVTYYPFTTIYVFSVQSNDCLLCMMVLQGTYEMTLWQSNTAVSFDGSSGEANENAKWREEINLPSKPPVPHLRSSSRSVQISDRKPIPRFFPSHRDHSSPFSKVHYLVLPLPTRYASFAS
jgi:hypothetical protein